MRKSVAVAFAMFGVASSAWGQSTTDTQCRSTSSDSMNCSSTTTPTGPTAAQVEQQRELNENASKLGAALGDLIYQKRMQHAQERAEKKAQKKAEAREIVQQEKSDLATVEFCYQHPHFSNSCEQSLAHTTSYCLANPKSPLCKDVAKLGPPLVARRVDAPPIPKAQTAGQPITQAATAQPREIIAPQSQTADTSTPRPEVSVAEAARQARIAKAVKEAKEKAERDNPPPQR